MATPLGPEPLPAPIQDRPEEYRHLFCSSYDVCLAKAAHENWASWTCAHCVRFQRLRRARTGEAAGRALGRRHVASIRGDRVVYRGEAAPGAEAIRADGPAEASAR